jgi:hypothetical protein
MSCSLKDLYLYSTCETVFAPPRPREGYHGRNTQNTAMPAMAAWPERPLSGELPVLATRPTQCGALKRADRQLPLYRLQP